MISLEDIKNPKDNLLDFPFNSAENAVLNNSVETIKVHKHDEVHVYIETSSSIDRELSEFFKFRVPGYQFMPSYKNKIWDGYIRLYNVFTKQLYSGLCPYIITFAKERNYHIEIDSALGVKEKFDEKDCQKFLKTLKLPFKARDYQVDAIVKSIQSKKLLLLSPTASGKSLIIYALTRFYSKKTLIIVPTISLVTQMYGDFKEYAKNDKSFNVEKKCHTIHQGQEKNAKKDIYISTWQSIYRMPKKYFEQFDVVIGDEAHLMKAKSLTSILTKLTKAKYRFGTTGTLNESKTHKLVLEGLFGLVYRATTTKALMDKKQLASLNIKCILLNYSEDTCKEVKKKKYHDEIKFLVNHDKRNEFICDLSIKMKSNSLILFQYVKHGKELHRLISEKAHQKRKVFFVYGGTGKDDREEVRKITEKEKDAIIIASVGVFSTGVNIKNLVNIIFASPSKSRIRTLQSIGRGLRIGKYQHANLYDIVDDLSYKAHKNFALLHFLERMRIYNEEKFNYQIFKLKIEGRNDVPTNSKANKRR